MDNIVYCSYKYTVDLIYVDLISGVSTQIKSERIKSIIIDHDYNNRIMPIILINLSVDKSMLDHMILNMNKNFLTFAMYKYDELNNENLVIECFRDKFTYFLPNNVNKNNDIDYNDATQDEYVGNTYKDVTIGLMCINHINNNKKSIELNIKNTSMFDCVRYCTSHFNKILIEPFNYNDTFNQFIMPAFDSVNKELQYLNDQKVFYSTPYRYYNDFNYTYIVSSRGVSVPRRDEKYGSVVIDIKETLEDESNTPGISINKTRGHYNVVVNYLNATVFDNSIINKSKNKVHTISANGDNTTTLNNVCDYSTDKTYNVRLNNDNEHMMENIIAKNNSSNVFINITKSDLDTDVFSINKQISLHNIDRYSSTNGNYLLSRKLDTFIMQDEVFGLSTTLSLKKIG